MKDKVFDLAAMIAHHNLKASEAMRDTMQKLILEIEDGDRERAAAIARGLMDASEKLVHLNMTSQWLISTRMDREKVH